MTIATLKPKKIKFNLRAKPEVRKVEWFQGLQSALVSPIVDLLKTPEKRDSSTLAKSDIGYLLDEYLKLRLIDENKVPVELRDLFSESFLVSFINVGNVVYTLRQESAAAFIEDYQICVIERFQQLHLRGNGRSTTEAIGDLNIKVHQLFQRLHGLVPGEMTQEDRMQWCHLSDVIDIQKYEEQTPIQFRKIAEVVSVSPFKVRWWGDEEPTCLDLRIAPPKLAGLTEGNKFEAVVEFSRKTREITKILTFEYLKPMSSCDAPPISGLQGLTKVTLEDIWGDE